MKPLNSVVALVLLSACSASQQSTTSGTAFTAADSSAIAGGLDRMVAAARAGNWEAWGAEYTTDPLRFPPNSPPLVGKAAADAFNHAAPKFSTFDAKLTSVIGSGDLAVTTGTFMSSAPAGKDSGGKATPAFRDEGSFMQTLRKQPDGSWKVSRDIWNSSLPAGGSVVAATK